VILVRKAAAGAGVLVTLIGLGAAAGRAELCGVDRGEEQRGQRADQTEANAGEYHKGPNVTRGHRNMQRSSSTGVILRQYGDLHLNASPARRSLGLQGRQELCRRLMTHDNFTQSRVHCSSVLGLSSLFRLVLLPRIWHFCNHELVL
jgi:hypothetical protein